MEAKISYCQLNMPSEICQFNTPAVTLRGDGPFHFEVYGDFQCKCNRRLFAHRSWKWGDYNYIEYSCGKVEHRRRKRGPGGEGAAPPPNNLRGGGQHTICPPPNNPPTSSFNF